MDRAEIWLHRTLDAAPAGRRSATVTSMPRRARSRASVKPTGPAPVTSTSVSIFRSVITATECLMRTVRRNR